MAPAVYSQESRMKHVTCRSAERIGRFFVWVFDRSAVDIEMKLSNAHGTLGDIDVHSSARRAEAWLPVNEEHSVINRTYGSS